MSRILIVDDDPSIGNMLARMVRKAGNEAQCASRLDEAVELASSNHFDLVLLDVNLPDGSGLDALPLFAEGRSRPEVIIITGEGDADGAALAIRSGAWDYIQKPASIERMKLSLLRALQYREEKRARSQTVNVMAVKRAGIIGNSPQLLSCFDQVARVACTDANILVIGETGTGKELFAHAVHENSPRHNRPFVVLDCSALPETLVESLLFGHSKGAFTSADKPHEGLIKQADGGTLFLDEVGELPLQIQKAFLRVLQERRFRPLGSRTEIASDFRLVAATNRNLGHMVLDGSFRHDLLFRLRSFVIDLPPLRERTGDIQDLMMHHLARVCERLKIGLKGLAPEFLEALNSYPWPGNVRELLQALERAVAAALFEPTLHVKHLPDEIRIELVRDSLAAATKSTEVEGRPPRWTESPLALKQYRENADRQYLLNLMAYTQGNVRRACSLSGLSRSRLYDLLKHHQISHSN
jgi:two-component system NtrC family response regulator